MAFLNELLGLVFFVLVVLYVLHLFLYTQQKSSKILRFVKTAIRKTLDQIVFYRSHDFWIAAQDILRRTTARLGDGSPLTLYVDWRHNQIDRQYQCGNSVACGQLG